ncbi:MAG: NAD(P)-binding protein, partial [Tannerellaceae bacterium]|nr:NAD(P)-binding protein [Tannerellaceae bacterium]
MRKESIIIIGGGVGGLFCGAILSKEGYRVKIFEKHGTIGGGLHQFKRKGVSFETGMHVIGAFQSPDGVLYRICSYLGIMHKISILPEDDDCFELLHIALDKKKYRMAKGFGAFIEALSKEFPEERENIIRYLRAIYSICDEVKLYNLEKADSNYHNYSDKFMTSVGDFIDS